MAKSRTRGRAARSAGGAAAARPSSTLRLLAALPRNGRNLALAALVAVDGGRTAQQALAEALAPAGAGPDGQPRENMPAVAGIPHPGGATALGPGGLADQEKHLCSELAYGYLRHEIRIAHILCSVLPRPDSLPRPFLLALGLAVYGMLYQERVPHHALVNEAVEQVRKLYGQGLARVANGALRSVQRLGDAVTAVEFYAARPRSPLVREDGGKAGRADASLEALSRLHSVPLWTAELWSDAYGPDAARMLLRRSAQRPWSALRINAGHPQARALLAELLSLPGCARVGEWGAAFPPGTLPRACAGRGLDWWRAAGAVSFQSAGSQLVLRELGLADWREPVWDVCAGYGGKTAALLEWGVPVALSTDLSSARLRGVPEQCARLGLAAPLVCRADATRVPLRAWNGHMLVDAPCSGLGVLARRPDIRRRCPEHLAELRSIQRGMLARLMPLLRPGRSLAYITCTLNPAENEEAVACALALRPHARLERQWQTPHDHPWLEGMYGALLTVGAVNE